jgi:type II secretory pathway predicted ATPase ExeA
VDDDPHAKRSLADDPIFLASLTDLDRGLEADDGEGLPITAARRTTSQRLERQAVVDPAAPPPSARRAAQTGAAPPLSPPLAVAPGQRRPLLDLFPPSPAGRDLPSGPMSGAAAGPAIVRASAARRAPPPVRHEAVTYETFYGLNEKPFSVSTDPKFLYHSASHDQAAKELLNAIHRKDGIVLVTGEFGVGKTTLCRVVMEELDRRTLTSVVLEPIDSVEDLFKTVLADFGVASKADVARAPVSRAELSATLRSFIASLSALQANAVIILDEAQNLPVDVLQEIPGLAAAGGDSRLLQVVLAGQPTLTNLLKRPELRLLDEDVAVRSKLGPLARDDIGGYVMHRLSVAGHTSRVDFDESALSRIHDLSGGVPRVVNLLCDRALSRGHEVSASVLDGRLIDTAAEDLDLAQPANEHRGIARFVVTAVALLALMLVGAGGALWVFHDAVTRTLVQWESVPPAPGGPVQRLPLPLRAIPPPTDVDPSSRPPLG